MVILENIDIDIDIDKAILQNIDIDKISNRFKFGISNRATPNAILSCDTQLTGSRSYLGKWVLCLGRVPCVVTWAFGLSPVFSSIQYSAVFPNASTAR